MKKTVMARIPINFHDYLKNQAKSNNTNMRIEANNMLNDYFKLKKLETRLENKRGKLIIIK